VQRQEIVPRELAPALERKIGHVAIGETIRRAVKAP